MRSILFGITLLGMAAPAAGQGGNINLVGRAVDAATHVGIADVRVELMDSRSRRVATSSSDSAGVFRFLRVNTGEYSVRATAIGYAATVTPIFVVESGRPIDLLVRLGVSAVPLEPLTVSARAMPSFNNPALAGFALRARRGIGGHFVTREELEARQPRQLSDLLRTTGSFTADNGRRMIINTRTGCQPAIFLDGQLIFNEERHVRGRGSGALDAMNTIHWPNVEGLELYAGAASVPSEFTHVFTGCGVIAIWTRM